MQKKHYLSPIFAPRHIAVVGASDSPDSVGHLIFSNLLTSKLQIGRGDIKLSPVNLKHKIVAGINTVAHLRELEEMPDMVIIVTPAESYQVILKECHELGINHVMMIKINSDDDGEERQLTKAAIRQANQLGIRILGTTLFGLICPHTGINACTYTGHVKAGNVAVVGHSSSLCSAILDWSHEHYVGFSMAVSFNSHNSNIALGEILDYLVHDSRTDAIILLIHQTDNGRRLMSALKEAARSKPVLVLKIGRAEELRNNNQQSTMHVADLILPSEVFNHALNRTGALSMSCLNQVFDAVQILAAKYRVQGNRLAIVSNGVGLGMVSADVASDKNIVLAEFSGKTVQAISQALPEVEAGNPLDLLGNAGSLRFRTAVKICIDDHNIDAVMVLFAPQGDDRSEHLKIAEMMVQLQKESSKPILLVWVGEEKVSSGRRLFSQNNCIQFHQPRSALEVFANMAQFNQNQKRLMTIPSYKTRQLNPNIALAKQIIEEARETMQYVLPEYLSKKLLACFNVECNYTALAHDKEEAVEIANSIGYPIALKVDSPHILHKSNIGGVRLNISNEEELRDAYDQISERTMVIAPHAMINGMSVQNMLPTYHIREVKISMVQDDTFGPVITFAAGGDAAIQKDRSIALPPLRKEIIDTMIAQTKISQTFDYYKNMQPINRDALYKVMFGVSELAAELPEVSELKIDLLLSPQGAIASDVRVIINNEPPSERYSHMAIMPYPRDWESRIQLKDGTPVLIRPVQDVDASAIQEFARNLSDESRYNRFMSNVKELSDNVLVRFTQLDYDREVGLIMQNEQDEILSVARYVTDPDSVECEFAVSVADNQQGKGIGSIMMNQLFEVARKQGLKSIRGDVLADNESMQGMMRKLGFTIEPDPDDETVTIVRKAL